MVVKLKLTPPKPVYAANQSDMQESQIRTNLFGSNTTAHNWSGSPDSSLLSSVPSNMGLTPDGRISSQELATGITATQDGSPVRRSARKRKSPTRPEGDALETTTSRARRQPILPSIETAPATATEHEIIPQHRSIQPIPINERTEITSDDPSPDTTATPPEPDQSSPTPPVPKKLSKSPDEETKKAQAERRKLQRFQRALEHELHTFAIHERWPEFKANEVIMYGADGATIYTPAIALLSNASSPASAKKAGKPNGKSNKTNSGGKGRNNAGKDRDAAPPPEGRANGDSPDPFQQQATAEDDANMIKMLKKRQAELRNFFTQVGGQQREILDQLATRDLNKMARKAKAHKQVPEHDELTQDLTHRQADAEEIIRQEYGLKITLAEREMQMETEVINQQYRQRVEQARDEHTRGAAGDIALLKNARAARGDENHTNDGSDADYFPQYHEFPESNAQVRGYVSSRITDEKPFKVDLPSFDELASREVIEDEVTRPIIDEINRKQAEKLADAERQNTERQIQALRKKTRTMLALTDEAEKQLDEMKGYLIPRPMCLPQDQQFALSRLADVSEFMSRQHPHQQYIYMPLPPGVKFPREALTFNPTPMTSNFLFPQPVVASSQPEACLPPPQHQQQQQQQQQPPPRGALQPDRRGGLRSLAPQPPSSTPMSMAMSMAPSQSSIPRHPPPPFLQPAPPGPPFHHQQFTFVKPQHPPQSRTRGSGAVGVPAPALPSPSGVMPMQFVNSTPESAGGRGVGAGGMNEDKGKGRTLLPKRG